MRNVILFLTFSTFSYSTDLSALRCPIRFFRASASSTHRVSCQERSSGSAEVRPLGVCMSACVCVCVPVSHCITQSSRFLHFLSLCVLSTVPHNSSLRSNHWQHKSEITVSPPLHSDHVLLRHSSVFWLAQHRPEPRVDYDTVRNNTTNNRLISNNIFHLQSPVS